MKLFLVILSALLVAVFIALLGFVGVERMSKWQESKNDALRLLNAAREREAGIGSLLNQELSIPTSVISGLGSDGISEHLRDTREITDALVSARNQSDAAAQQLQSVLNNKPFFLPLTKSERVALDAIREPTPPLAKATPASSPQLKPTGTPAPVTITLTRPISIQIPYGSTTLPSGSRVTLISRSGDKAHILYQNQAYEVPIYATDLKP
jgi:hypothetical protein